MDLYLTTSARLHFSMFLITWDMVEVLELHSGKKFTTHEKSPRPANETRDSR